MFFSDIHSHLLCGADDGAKTYEEMIAMADAAYKDGVRLICATPHCCPDLFGNNREAIDDSFAQLKEYCKEKYPDLSLILGNELYYGGDGMAWLKNGLCKPLGGTKYVLTEFGVDETERSIERSVHELFNMGYVPVIAHAERYTKLSFGKIEEFHNNGVLIQVNCANLKKIPFFEKRRLIRLLTKGVVDFVSTDAHDLHYRPPIMSEFYRWVSEKCGEEYSNRIFWMNAKEIFGDTAEE